MQASNIRNSRPRACLLITLSVILFVFAPACGQRPKGEPLAPIDGVFTVDANGIKNGTAKFFSYNKGGKDVVFFVARSRSGNIKTAFDACITCYPHRKGYRQEADRVVCIYCGTAFEIEDLDEGKGNCIPIKISHRLAGDKVVISQEEINRGVAWF